MTTIPWIESRLSNIELIEGSLRDVLDNPFWEGAIVGSGVVTKKLGRHKSIKLIFAEQQWVAGIPGVAAGTAARWGLEIAFAAEGMTCYSPLRWDREKYKHLLGAPQYCIDGGASGPGGYWDIQGCFWNLYRRLPLRLKYLGDGALVFAKGKLHEEALPPDWGSLKPVRNALPGLWRASRIHRIKDGKIAIQDISFAPHRSLYHWLLIREALHHIAYMAVKVFGALYWHTDGGIWIHPFCNKAWDFCCWLWDVYGLQLQLRDEGYVTISCMNRYSITEFPQPEPVAKPGCDTINYRDGFLPTILRFL